MRQFAIAHRHSGATSPLASRGGASLHPGVMRYLREAGIEPV